MVSSSKTSTLDSIEKKSNKKKPNGVELSARGRHLPGGLSMSRGSSEKQKAECRLLGFQGGTAPCDSTIKVLMRSPGYAWETADPVLSNALHSCEPAALGPQQLTLPWE